MKKTKLFSRIFAAVLAAAIAATTLITNSGTGLLAFAGTSETYSVKIISPDVPADGKTYTYNFYQIIAGEVEDDGGKNVLANPKWGEAMTDMTTVNDCEGYNSKITTNNALFLALGRKFEYNNGSTTSYVSFDDKGPDTYMYKSIGKMFAEIYATYGGSSDPFKDKFGSRDLCTAAGLVEVLSKDTAVSKDNAALKAFADLLINGVKYNPTANEEIPKENYKDIKFITGKPQATQEVTSKNGGPYEVTGLKPGYYLVTCVDSNNKLTNADYNSTTGDNKVQNKTNSPIKPVSTMLILVGPANDGVAEIVGKNAYSVPTVTLDIYQKPVKLSEEMVLTDSTKFNNEVNDIDKIVKKADSEWKNTGSFDYYGDTGKDAFLYRIGITLPLNFDQYANSGYFLAVLDQYCHFNTETNIKTDGEISRVENVRPYVYVQHNGEENATPQSVGRFISNTLRDDPTKDTPADGIMFGSYTKTTSVSNQNILCNEKNSNTSYTQNSALGFKAKDQTGIFCFGDLYEDKPVTVAEGEEPKTERKPICDLEPGDTIYIYYPAVLNNSNNRHSSMNYLVNTNRIWAVYSNNPHADKLGIDKDNGSDKRGYTHVIDNQVGVSPIAEANVTTYAVTLKVDGTQGYSNGAKFALYKEVTDVDGENQHKEYAFIFIQSNVGYLRKWIPESEFIDKIVGYNSLTDEKKEEALIKQLLNNDYTGSSRGNSYTYLSSNGGEGISASGDKLCGLAAGEYKLLELTISSKGAKNENPPVDDDNESHPNIISKYYSRAKEPITFNITAAPNESLGEYFGYVTDGISNSNKIIQKLTVDFARDEKDVKSIKTYVYKWDSADPAKDKADNQQHSATLNIDNTDTTKSTYATPTGEFTIEVFHITNNTIWLPETGGIGTAIFFIVGGTIVVAATVLIVTRFRVKRERL